MSDGYRTCCMSTISHHKLNSPFSTSFRFRYITSVYRYNLTKHSQTIQNRLSSREFELQIVIYNLNYLIVLIQGLPYRLKTSNSNDKNRLILFSIKLYRSKKGVTNQNMSEVYILEVFSPTTVLS